MAKGVETLEERLQWWKDAEESAAKREKEVNDFVNIMTERVIRPLLLQLLSAGHESFQHHPLLTVFQTSQLPDHLLKKASSSEDN